MSETTKPQANSAFGVRSSAFCKIPLPDHHRPFYMGAPSGILFSYWITAQDFYLNKRAYQTGSSET